MFYRGSSAVYAKFFKDIRGPRAIVLQGMVIAVIGLILTVANLNNTVNYQKNTGLVDTVVADGYLKLQGSDTLYAYVPGDFHPTWDGTFIADQKVDVIYEGGDPNVVEALKFYDSSNVLTQKLTTATYDQNPSTYQKGGISPQIGLGILVIGLILTAIGASIMIVRSRSRHIFDV